MKKTLLPAVLALVALSGCSLMDTLFYNAEAVSPKDLPAFSGAVASTKDEVLVAASSSTSAVVASSLPAMPAEARAAMLKVFPRLAIVDPVGVPSASAARTITYTDDSDALNGVYAESYVFDAEDFGTAGLVNVDGFVEYKVVTDDVNYTIDASGKAEIDATVGETGSLNGAELHLLAKGNGNLASDPVTYAYDVNAYAAISLNAGVSVDADDVAGTKGGKFILSFKFVENVDVSYDPAYPTDTAGDVQVELNVTVYDAANNKTGEYVFTADDLLAGGVVY